MKKEEKTAQEIAKKHENIIKKAAELPSLWKIFVSNIDEEGYKQTKYKIASKRYNDALAQLIDDVENLKKFVKTTETKRAKKLTRDKIAKSVEKALNPGQAEEIASTRDQRKINK